MGKPRQGFIVHLLINHLKKFPHVFWSAHYMHDYPSYNREGLVERGWLKFWYDTQYVS
jgi:hypothetical protein